MDTKEIVKEYFGKHWTSRTSSYRFSNHSIAEKIAPHEKVIDVGCGNNEFKPLVKNLLGIDLINPKADIIIDIDSFETSEKFDVALCLGSIQYGDTNDIKRQIKKVVSLLNPVCRIYWRTNTGTRDHKNDLVQLVPYYDWTIDKHYAFAEEFNFKVDFVAEDLYGRLYAEWSKNQ